MIRALFALMLASPAPVAAETLVERIDQCLEEVGLYGDGVGQCLGLYSQQCMEDDANSTTSGMVACLSTESAAWDDVLNREYRKLLPRLDEEQKAALREVQRKWIEFRDLDCAFPHVLVRGTLAQPWGADCVMQHTARRAYEIRGIVAYTEN